MDSYCIRTFVAVATMLVAAAGASWGVRMWRDARVVQAGGEQQEAAIHSALLQAEEQFATTLETLLVYGQNLADNPSLRAGLHDGAPGSGDMVRFFAGLDLPDRWSVEAYDVSGQLMAWNGRSFPLDTAFERGLAGPASAIVEDGAWRRALVVWYPVLESERALGAVRIIQLVEARFPVQNDFLRDYDLTDIWQSRIRWPVDISFGAPPNAGRISRLLHGLDGEIIGHASASVPSTELLRARSRRRYGDLIAFWGTLLIGWILFSAWSFANRYPKRIAPLFLFGLAWWLGRFGLVWLDVPARWQQGKAPLNALFDPAHLHSTLGGGLLRSSADVLLTGIFALLFALVVLRSTSRRYVGLSWQNSLQTRPSGRLVAQVAAVATGGLGLVAVFGNVARRVMHDSTLDYLARDGLLPDPLILVVFWALLFATLSVLLLMTSLFLVALGSAAGRAHRRHHSQPAAALAVIAPLVVVVSCFHWQGWTTWSVGSSFLLVALVLATAGLAKPGSGLRWITLRRILPTTFAIGMLLYPLALTGLKERRQTRMENAARSFERERDPGISDAIRELLAELDVESQVALSEGAALDSVAALLMQRHLGSSVGPMDAALLFLDETGAVAGHHYMGNGAAWPALQTRDMLLGMASAGSIVVPVRERDRIRFAGLVRLGRPGEGWAFVMAEPHADSPAANDSPLMRVLATSGASNQYAGLSLAAFSANTLVYSVGRSFRRYRLDRDVAQTLDREPQLWRSEEIDRRQYETYYQRIGSDASQPRIIAVRASAFSAFDHLFYLLRLTVAGLVVGLPCFLIGIFWRVRTGLLPARRVHFRDRVLNAFLVVASSP